MKTVSNLFQAVGNDLLTDLHRATLVDYFNYGKNYEHIQTIFAVYQGMIMYLGITEEQFETAFDTGRLDELIHEAYKVNKSGQYYRDFVSAGIKIGRTVL